MNFVQQKRLSVLCLRRSSNCLYKLLKFIPLKNFVRGIHLQELKKKYQEHINLNLVSQHRREQHIYMKLNFIYIWTQKIFTFIQTKETVFFMPMVYSTLSCPMPVPYSWLIFTIFTRDGPLQSVLSVKLNYDSRHVYAHGTWVICSS